MPIVDPEWLPEVAQAVDLSRERPTVDEVNFDVRTPLIGVKAVFANDSLVARAFSFLMVGAGAAGIGYVIKFFAPPLLAVIALVVVLVAGLVFVDRWRGR
jgi:cytochrome c biogenesis protein CcdA